MGFFPFWLRKHRRNTMAGFLASAALLLFACFFSAEAGAFTCADFFALITKPPQVVLPEQDRTAILSYTLEVDGKYNQWLKKFDSLELEQRQEILRIIGALKRLPPTESSTWSGQHIPKADLEKILATKEFVPNRFFSTSYSRWMAGIFFRGSVENQPKAETVRVLFWIKGKSGRSLKGINPRNYEREVLYLPDTKFRVTSVRKIWPRSMFHPAYRINLEEIK